VVLSTGERERYLVIDGYKRIAALEQLGRDTIEATVWAMSAAEALLLEWTLLHSPGKCARTRLAVGGDGTKFRLWVRGTRPENDQGVSLNTKPFPPPEPPAEAVPYNDPVASRMGPA
jgi:hypothetical protein